MEEVDEIVRETLQYFHKTSVDEGIYTILSCRPSYLSITEDYK